MANGNIIYNFNHNDTIKLKLTYLYYSNIKQADRLGTESFFVHCMCIEFKFNTISIAITLYTQCTYTRPNLPRFFNFLFFFLVKRLQQPREYSLLICLQLYLYLH